MYKVVSIGEGEIDRFLRVSDEHGNEFEIFDYSASTVMDLSKAFKLEVEKSYYMNLMLFGEVVNKDDSKQYGKKIKFKISGRLTIGKTDFFSVVTNIGAFLIMVDERSLEINQSDSFEGYFRYSRIDLVKLDDKVHPEF